ARAEDTDTLDCHRLDLGVGARVLLELGRGEEDLDEPRGDRRDEELAEMLGLGRVPGFFAIFIARAQRVERRKGRRIMTAGFFLELPLRLRKEHAASDGILLERQLLQALRVETYLRAPNL